MYLDHANFAREAEEFEAELNHRRLIFPILPWYKRPEFWAIILGAVSLLHGLFVQWAWPRVQKRLNLTSPYADPRSTPPDCDPVLEL